MAKPRCCAKAFFYLREEIENFMKNKCKPVLEFHLTIDAKPCLYGGYFAALE